MSFRLSVFIVCLLVMMFLPLLPALDSPVEAAATMSLSISKIDVKAVEVSGKVEISNAVLLYHGFKYRKIGDNFWSSEDLNRVTSNPFKVILSGLSENTSYEICGYCVYQIFSKQYHIESPVVTFRTNKRPALGASFDQITTTSARMVVSITLNGNTLQSIDYTVNKVSDNSLIVKELLMTNVTSGGTKTKTITGLSNNTEYYVYLICKTALGSNFSYGPYNFKTARFAIVTTFPRNTPTPTPKISPTPTVKPTPSPTPTPTPTATPSPTSTAKPTSLPTPTAKPTASTTTASSTTTISTSSEVTSDESTTESSAAETTASPETASETSLNPTTTQSEPAQSTEDPDNQNKSGRTSTVLIIVLGIIALALVSIAIMLVIGNIKKK